jgi:hypothetical protein
VFLIHGVYGFRPRRVAFRNDFCVQCNAARTAIRVRTFDVMHVFWVPLVPLGFFKRWLCAVCGRRPDGSRIARRVLKVAALMALAAMAVFVWGAAVPNVDPFQVTVVWAVRIATTLALAVTIWSLKEGSRDAARRQYLAALPPNNAVECPVCRARLIPGDPWRCPQCDIVRQ